VTKEFTRMSKQTRKRELDRLRARREAERQRARRRRALLTYGGLGVVLVVAAVAGALWLTRDDQAPTAAPATTVQQFNDARAGAPTAPAQVACGGQIPPKVQHPTFSKPPTTKVDPDKTYLATFQTSCGDFTIRLDPKKAPETTANFMFLAGRHFYDSTWFHRIVPGGAAGGIGVVQGGDPQGDGKGGPGYAIKDELPASPAAYKKYSVAMANSGPNTGGSQFFINFQDNAKGLQADYSVFGQVVSGQKVVDRIAKVPVTLRPGADPQQGPDLPTEAAWIEKLTVAVS
jgi:peptidyl-prolyl cis-trans isomerase B (cyclophilin B)